MIRTEKFISVKDGKEVVSSSTNPLWESFSSDLLSLELDCEFNLKAIQNRKPNLWRYKEALPPIDEKHIVSMNEGFTPLLFMDFLGKKVGIKQEQLFSTGSYKDRGATLLMSNAKSLGIKHVVQDSSGNAGCAIAAYAALAGMACDIYIPSSTSSSKIKQIEAYGARIFSINGSREDTAKAALLAAKQHYYASHCWNPYFLQGTKTFAYEICEQLKWKAPDAVVLPAGNGTLVLGCSIGFNDLFKAGVISHIPKIIAIQAENCAPLAHSFFSTPHQFKTTPTLAEGIAIAQPVRSQEIIAAVQSSNGTFITVTEEEIKASHIECGLKGFYIEPTAAATIAGLKKYLSGYEAETIVSLFSGHGLKK